MAGTPKAPYHVEPLGWQFAVRGPATTLGTLVRVWDDVADARAQRDALNDAHKR